MRKNPIVVLIGLLMMITSLQAQDFRFGASAGVDAARFALSGASGGPINYRTELAGGLFAELSLSSTISLQAEVNYSPQGAAVILDDASTVGSYQINYFTIPVLAKLYGTSSLSFLIGPQLGILSDAKTKSSGDPDQDIKDQLNSTDFYGVFGTEYGFENGVFIGIRYHVGLSNIVEDTSGNTEIKNRYFGFRLGYRF